MSFVLANYVNAILIKTDRNICNASILFKNNSCKLIGRNVTYSFIDVRGESMGWPVDPKYYTDNILYNFNVNTGETAFVKNLTTSTAEDKKNYDLFGDEDMRVINWNDKTYVSYTKIHAKAADFAANKHEATMHFAELSDDLSLVNEQAIKTDKNIEKNWAPIEDKPFTYMYDVNTSTTIDTSGNKSESRINNSISKYRGSTPFIRIGNQFIGIIHERFNNDFYHRFICLNEDLMPVCISDAFKFFGAQIEYTTSMQFVNGELVIIASVLDQISYIFKVSLAQLTAIFAKSFSNDLVQSDLYEKFYEDAKSNNYKLAMFAIASHCKKREIVEFALKNMDKLTTLSFRDKYFLMKSLAAKL